MEKPRRAGSLPALGRARLGTATLWHYPRLWLNLGRGYYNRLQVQGWWPFLSTMALVLAAAAILWLVGEGGQVTLARGILAVFLIMLARWLFRTRGRVVVESFVDFTKEDAKAVSGLSTLLVTELGRLRSLYQQINDLSLPTAVGVESHGGFGRGKEAGVFLTVSADDATNVLEDAVASDAGISVGPAKLSLKPILTFINRVSRGPRVVGSVHLTEAGGGPTLTAQLLGKGECITWRIDQPREPESPEQRKAFLDTMVRELACQMFSQLTLRGSVRPKAVEAFNEYMQLYDEARRTPRDRTRLLKQAQGELLKAVAEDENFDLAYYNLGVIYMQLSHTERVAEQVTDDATSQARFDRSELDSARREAARVAFERATIKNPERWEAYYALAVTVFSEIQPEIKIDELPSENGRRHDQLREVISRCDQALAVAPDRAANLAAIYDLRGMAQSRLGDDFRAALSSHRKAVYHSWIEYCRVRRRDTARPDGTPDLVAYARANATAALHNLALTHERRALVARRTLPRAQLDWMAVHRNFRRAVRLAGEGSATTAASRFEHGCAFERRDKHKRAAKQFKLAVRIHARSSEYHGRWAQALAGQGAAAEARRYALLALDLLAQPFSQAVLPFTTDAASLRCEAALNALEKTYETLEDEDGTKWVADVRALQETIKDSLSFVDPKTQTRRKTEDPLGKVAKLDKRRRSAKKAREEEPRQRIATPERDVRMLTDPVTWQLDQIELAIGRLYAEGRDWNQAHTAFRRLVNRLTNEKRTKRIVEFGAYAHQARALRECDKRRYVDALSVAAEGIRRAPLDVEARREAGRAHFALRQFSDALDAWEHALWISPGDPYLHYEIAMCFRELARDQTDEMKRRQELDCAKMHFEKAQELFDGEDLSSEAWTRLWRGKIALEAGDAMEGLEYLKGAEHGSARAAAALLLGEAHLSLGQRPGADHAFDRCEQALGNKEDKSELPKRSTIDALWGDELPEEAVRSRIARGRAEAKFLVAGDWQNPEKTLEAEEYLENALAHLNNLKGVDPARARDTAMTKILETRGRIRQANGDIAEALDLVGERLRYEETAATKEAEAELLELRANRGKHLDERTRFRIAAEQAKKDLSLSRDGRMPTRHPST